MRLPAWGLHLPAWAWREASSPCGQPIERLSFDLNHNYFRDVPTFDTALAGTGLLDKYLFQGFSAGVRGEIVRHVTLYTTLGASSRSGDVRNSINQMYGVTLNRIWRSGIRADVHYSRFSSSFGDGVYKVVSLSRNVGERFKSRAGAGVCQPFPLRLPGQGQSLPYFPITCSRHSLR